MKWKYIPRSENVRGILKLMYICLIRRLLGSTKNHENPWKYREKQGKPTNNSENIYLDHKMHVGLIRQLLGLTPLIQMDAVSRTKSSALYKAFYPYRRKWKPTSLELSSSFATDIFWGCPIYAGFTYSLCSKKINAFACIYMHIYALLAMYWASYKKERTYFGQNMRSEIIIITKSLSSSSSSRTSLLSLRRVRAWLWSLASVNSTRTRISEKGQWKRNEHDDHDDHDDQFRDGDQVELDGFQCYQYGTMIVPVILHLTPKKSTACEHRYT